MRLHKVAAIVLSHFVRCIQSECDVNLLVFNELMVTRDASRKTVDRKTLESLSRISFG